MFACKVVIFYSACIFFTGNILPHSRQVAGQWIKGYSAGGSRNSNSYTMNPKYWLKVSEKGEVLVSLLQHRDKKIMTKPMHMPFGNPRKKHNQFYQAIALHIWKVCVLPVMKPLYRMYIDNEY